MKEIIERIEWGNFGKSAGGILQVVTGALLFVFAPDSVKELFASIDGVTFEAVCLGIVLSGLGLTGVGAGDKVRKAAKETKKDGPYF